MSFIYDTWFHGSAPVTTDRIRNSRKADTDSRSGPLDTSVMLPLEHEVISVRTDSGVPRKGSGPPLPSLERFPDVKCVSHFSSKWRLIAQDGQYVLYPVSKTIHQCFLWYINLISVTPVHFTYSSSPQLLQFISVTGVVFKRSVKAKCTHPSPDVSQTLPLKLYFTLSHFASLPFPRVLDTIEVSGESTTDLQAQNEPCLNNSPDCFEGQQLPYKKNKKTKNNLILKAAPMAMNLCFST